MKANMIRKLQDNVVQVECEFGSFYGQRIGNMPVTDTCFFELDCDCVADIEAIKFSNLSEPSILDCADHIVISGLAETVEDCVLFLRLSDSLMMIDLSDDIDWYQFIGHYINVSLQGVEIYGFV